jgi:hypothetical protein
VMTMTITIRRTIIKVTVGYLLPVLYAVEQFSSLGGLVNLTAYTWPLC